MCTKKELNKKAQEISKFWFEEKQERTTPAVFSRTISQAKKLLECGYTEQEIKDAIVYLVKNPPKNGLSSLGYLNYVINDVLSKVNVIKFKDEIIKEQQKTIGILVKELNNNINIGKSDFANRFF